MAFFDPAAAAMATAVSGGSAALLVHRARGSLRSFFVTLVALCCFNLLIISFYAGMWSVPPLRDTLAAGAVGLFVHLAIFYLHMPSILLLGVDENLERHGAVITAIGQALDLVIFAAAISFVLRKNRARATAAGS